MKYYVVIQTVDITASCFGESLTVCDFVRRSNDGALSIISFKEPHPDSAKGYRKYTAVELTTEVLKDAEWVEVDET